MPRNPVPVPAAVAIEEIVPVSSTSTLAPQTPFDAAGTYSQTPWNPVAPEEARLLYHWTVKLPDSPIKGDAGAAVVLLPTCIKRFCESSAPS